ncbi:MAG: UbiA family prenyltransferase [Candidatus Hadarchaeum sp.]
MSVLKTQGIASGTALHRLLRHFPYTEMLALFLPVYAHLYTYGRIASPAALLFMIPFIFADAAGFVYNNMTDTRDDPYVKPNPLVRGEISLAQAQMALGISLTLSIGSFLLLYRTNIARFVYFAYLFLVLAYSGLGIRLKETLVGLLFAAFIIWIGGPLILLAEFKSFDKATSGLILGSWLVFIGREVLHTITDYETDLRSGYRTFAVRAGLRISAWVQNAAFVAGAMLLASSLYTYFGGWPTAAMDVSLFAIVVLAVVVHLVAGLNNCSAGQRTAYLLIRLFYVMYAAVILQLPPLLVLMFAWVFLTSKRS